MKQIYTDIWELAKPFYLKGRPMDIDHIEWMMEEALRIAEIEKLDDSLLMPLCILHDVGYSRVPGVESADYYQLDVRRLHMDEGAEICREILDQVKYDSDKSDKIAFYVSVHDNWAYGEVDLFINDPILGTFKDLDYLWIYSPKGFEAMKQVKKFGDQQMLEYLEAETSPIYGKKPFSNHSTKKLHRKYLTDRRKEVVRY